MQRSLVSSLPHPIATALQDFLDEDLPRSADELSELFVALVEYVGAVALADYLDGQADPGLCAQDPSLNGWLVSQLATGKAEAGHWARWTQIAVRATPHPAIPCLRDHVDSADLDDPEADLAWMLRFRNDVMHGGFVAPMPKIRQAIRRLEAIFERLAPLWALSPRGCTHDEPDSAWYTLTGLETARVDAPTIERDAWPGAGSVLLTDAEGRAVLAVHPGCEVDPEGHMHLQHAWKQNHGALFGRPAIRGFFERYQNERRGVIDASAWSAEIETALPERGRVARPEVDASLVASLDPPGQVIRLVGPTGSGRSTLVSQLDTLTGRTVYALPVDDPSVRMDPEVVRRWVLHTLSQHFIDAPPPDAVLRGRTGKKDRAAVDTWNTTMTEAMSQREPPILVVDDAERIGTGLYAGTERSGCLADARRFGTSVVLVHRPSAEPPSAGDTVITLTPWSADELIAWGDPEALLESSGGHVELLAHPDAARAHFQARLDASAQAHPLGAAVLDALTEGPSTPIEVADAIDAFSPQVDLTLRHLLDYLVEDERQPDDPDAAPERVYALYPAAQVVLAAKGGA